jgi:hypothetical protein
MNDMVFRNFGGNYQLRIDSAEDLKQVLELEEAHWTATSAPIQSFYCDGAFLRHLDHDRNQRIRSDELRLAIRWLFQVLADCRRLRDLSNRLALSAINLDDPEGRAIHSAAERILENLNLAGQGEISLSQVRDLKTILSHAASNGDGVIPPNAVDDPDTAEYIRFIMDTMGSVQDAGGDVGIDLKHLDAFHEQATAYLDWHKNGTTPGQNATTPIMCWGQDTPRAWDLIQRLDDKIESYFDQCDLARIDPRIVERLRLNDDALIAFDPLDPESVRTRLERSPLAQPDGLGALNLDGELNPHYIRLLRELVNTVLTRAFDQPADQLTRAQWRSLKTQFDAYSKWLAEKPKTVLATEPVDRLRAYLNGPQEDRLRQLIAKDQAVAEELDDIDAVEKLVLYQKLLMPFANSFVSFPNLYDPNRRSLFEAGTLILEGRALTLSVGVEDVEAHKAMARNSGICLLYLEITGQSEAQRFRAVTPVTAGDSDGLAVGKRGVFFTPDGREWDALIIDLIENPISLWEAFRKPFSRFRSYVLQQLSNLGGQQQTKLKEAFSSANSSAAWRDIMLAGSLGVAALGSSFAYLVQAIANVGIQHVMGVVLGLLALLILPGMARSYLLLRRRDLTTLLEASGWAIGIRIPLTDRLGILFTRVPALPKEAQLERPDLVARLARRFRVRRMNWSPLILFVLVCGLLAAAVAMLMTAGESA